MKGGVGYLLNVLQGTICLITKCCLEATAVLPTGQTAHWVCLATYNHRASSSGLTLGRGQRRGSKDSLCGLPFKAEACP